MTTEDLPLLDELYCEGDNECQKYNVSPNDVEMRMFTCSLVQNAAYLVLNFISQVCNGGFQQYIDNDYYKEEAHHLTKILNHINGNLSKRIVDLLFKAGQTYNVDDLYDDDTDFETVTQALDELDTEFYSYSENFELEVEDWIIAQSGRPTKKRV